MFRLMAFRRYLPWIRRLVPARVCRKIVEWIPSIDVQQLKTLIDIQTEHASPVCFLAAREAHNRNYHRLKISSIPDGRECGMRSRMILYQSFVSTGRVSGSCWSLNWIIVQANTRASKAEKLPEDQVLGQIK